MYDLLSTVHGSDCNTVVVAADSVQGSMYPHCPLGCLLQCTLQACHGFDDSCTWFVPCALHLNPAKPITKQVMCYNLLLLY